MGLSFDDGAFMVSGMIYAFRKRENRDMSYKYIMGIKDQIRLDQIRFYI